MELMEEDVKAADLVLWVGISFQQSASTLYFRKVRCWIQVRGGSQGGGLAGCVGCSTASAHAAELGLGFGVEALCRSVALELPTRNSHVVEHAACALAPTRRRLGGWARRCRRW
jgi:hypothetical protein